MLGSCEMGIWNMLSGLLVYSMQRVRRKAALSSRLLAAQGWSRAGEAGGGEAATPTDYTVNTPTN